MNEQDLYESIGQVDDDVLLRSDKKRRSTRPGGRLPPRRSWPRPLPWGIFFPGGPASTTAYAVAEASYPEMAPYPMKWPPTLKPNTTPGGRTNAPRTGTRPTPTVWRATSAPAFPPFSAAPVRENRAYSPLNVYMALAMLAELTGGESRDQILTLLGHGSIETLRAQANDLWNDHYSNDGATNSILAGSLWLEDGVPFNQDTLNTLAENYYASSFRGDLDSPAMTEALQSWINDQTAVCWPTRSRT